MNSRILERGFGLLLILLPVGVEAWRENADTSTPLRLHQSSPRAPSHLQLWFVQHDRDALGTPVRMIERLVPASPHAEFEVREWNLSGWIDAEHLGLPRQQPAGRIEARAWTELSYHESTISSQPVGRFDPGDGVPFTILDSTAPVPGLGLAITARPRSLTILGRVVDASCLTTAEDSGPILERFSEQWQQRTRSAGLRQTGHPDPLLRLASSTAPGAWLMLIGLMVLLGGSIWQRSAMAGFVFFFALSLTQRVHLERDLRALEAGDEPRSVAAAARLASNSLHPERAARALCERILDRPELSSSAPMLVALARSTRSCGLSPAVDRLVEQLADPVASGRSELGPALAQLRESRRRALETEAGPEGAQAMRALPD